MFLKHNLFTLFFFCVIVLGCFLPGSNLPKDNTQNLDKVIHVFLFMSFSLSALIGFVKQGQFQKLHYFPIRNVAIIAISLTVITEVVQHFFIPRRGFELLDIVADVCGFVVGLLLFLYIKNGDKIIMPKFLR